MAKLTPPLPPHGGDLDDAALRWGTPAQGWLDLSTGINPWPYPPPRLDRALWRRLPATGDEAALRRAAAAAYGCDAARILATPGTSALIQTLPRLWSPRKVAVLSPTYGEHAAAWTAAGHAVMEVSVPADAQGCDALVLVNPNNPDGRTFAPADILALAERFPTLVVDEAFADATPFLSVAGMARPGLIVLRSFGKFYGLAGLRLGFCLAAPELLDALGRFWGPWPVSGPALAIGARALADHAWAEASRAHLAHAADRLDAVLAGAGLHILGGTALFRLAEHPDAARLHERLGRAGILVRAFPHRPTWLRFGLPGGMTATRRLRRALIGTESQTVKGEWGE